MSRDLNNLFNIMQTDLSKSATNLGAVVIAVSFLEMLSVFFLLIVIFRKRDNGDSASNHEQNLEMGKQS